MIPRHLSTLIDARALRAVLLVLALSATGVAAQDAPAPTFDLTGAWILDTMSPNGAGTRDVTFVQEGNQLTGDIASSMAAGEIEGTIEGDRIEFVAVVYMDSDPFEITYRATFRDGKLEDGTIDFGSYGGGTFTGRRKPAG